MSEQLVRTSQTDLEIRGDGRTVVGIAMPFGELAEIRDMYGHYFESFQRGAFTRTINQRGSQVKFLAMHNRQAMPLGRATLLREDAAGLYAEFRVSATQAGDEALTLIKDRALDSLSIGFVPDEAGDRWSRDRSSVVRTSVRLNEVSAVSFPAYAGAAIAGVRAQAVPSLPSELALRRLALISKEL